MYRRAAKLLQLPTDWKLVPSAENAGPHGVTVAVPVEESVNLCE